MGYQVIEVKSRIDILLKLGMKKFDHFYSPCPLWKRECLAGMVTRTTRKKLCIPTDNNYAKLFDKESVYNSSPQTHDLENSLNSVSDIGFSREDFLAAKEEIKKKFIRSDDNKKPYVVFHPTASSPYKFYPLEFWASIGKDFIEQGHKLYIISGKNEIEEAFCVKLLKMLPSVTYLKNSSFMELCELIANCNYFIGLDSSIMHLAANFDVPIIGLWSFANYRRIHPYGQHAKVYLPSEVLKSTSFQYPKKDLPYLKRADAKKLTDIIMDKVKPSFEIDRLMGKNVQCYLF
jgi:ADP-heptose:LPS heptosyltransferase